MKRQLFFFLVLLMNIQCARSEAPNNAVQIKGTITDTAARFVMIRYVPMFIDNAFNEVEAHSISNGNICLEELTTDTPVIASFGALNSWMQRFYITPGDSVEFVTVSMQFNGRPLIAFEFTGRNAAHYNYEYLWRKFLDGEGYRSRSFRKGDDLMEYRTYLDSMRLKQLAFLENYKKEYQVSEEFYDYRKASINNEFIFKIYNNLFNEYVDRKNLPAGYLETDFVPQNDIAEYYYSDMLYKHIDGVIEKRLVDFRDNYQKILSEPEGQPREYLIALLIGHYADKKSEDSADILAAADEAHKYVTNARYLDYIGRAAEYLRKTQDLFPKEVISGTMLKPYGENKAIPLSEVLAKYAGKPVYIDFWASWCGPCREDISKSAEAKEYLASQGIEYVYFALGDKENAWKKAAVEDGITGGNQYFIVGGNPPVAEYLTISSIPRYVLLDKNHRVYNQNAPRPVESGLDALKDLVEKMTAGEPNYY